MSQRKLHVLLDGWALIYHSLSSSAFHLLEIYEALRDEVDLTLALPSEKPHWLAAQVKLVVRSRSYSALNHLLWVQSDLPKIANEIQSAVIHFTEAGAPLFAKQVLVYSPTNLAKTKEPRWMNFWERVDDALGLGGLSRAIQVEPREFFGESRTPARQADADLPFQSGILLEASPLLPETPYFLYQSFGDWERLRFLLQVWAKTTAHLGDQAALAIVCHSRAEEKRIKEHCSSEFYQTLKLYAEISPPTLVSLLKNATAFVQLEAEPPWGGTGQRAIRQGIPVIGFELPSLGDAIGAAGYLVPPEDERALSAALITVVVEEDVLQALRMQAIEQGRAWQRPAYRHWLTQLYRRAMAS